MEQERDPQLLWRRIGAGDRRAFTALYERYEDDVVRYCRALLRDGDDAREAANSTWAAVWRARASPAQRAAELRPWLFRIARNEAVSILRRRHQHEPLDVGLAGPADPVAEAELRERIACLRADLMTLTDHQRTALVLRELSGMGHEEIAGVLGVSAGAAKQTIYEARQALIDAEGGRALSCDRIATDLASGDRRVLRGRRLRAHLRSCAACRELAAGVGSGGERRGLRVLLPAPLAALLARITPEVAVGGGATATVVGGRLCAPLLAKVTTAAVAVAVGTAPHHARAAASHPKPPRPAAPQASSIHPHASRVRAEAPAAQGPPTHAARPHAGRPRAAKPRVARSHAAPSSHTVTLKPAALAAPASSSQAATPAKPIPPGQARRLAAVATPKPTPPGQAKKPGAAATPKPTPPGQARRQAAAPAASPAVPPAVPPGQAKRQDDPPPAAGAAPAVPPGQAKQQADPPAATALPPGQAKKLG